MAESTMYALYAFPACAIATKLLYNITKPVRVDVEKVTVTHPDTQEDVYLFKPTGIHKDYIKGLYGYDLIKAPRMEYTRVESIVAEQMALYNDEMDFWLTHGRDSEKLLGTKFTLFDPSKALVTDAQDPTRFMPASMKEQQEH